MGYDSKLLDVSGTAGDDGICSIEYQFAGAPKGYYFVALKKSATFNTSPETWNQIGSITKQYFHVIDPPPSDPPPSDPGAPNNPWQ